MKLVKSASGKNKIKMSHAEWTDLGKKAGWMKVAQQTISIDYNRLLQAIENKSFCTDPTQHPSAWSDTIAGVVYSGMTGNGQEGVSIYNQLTNNQGNKSAMSQLYNSTVSTATKDDGGWAQWDVMGKGWKGPKDTRENLNFYFTIEKTPENVQKFLKRLPNLVQHLRTYSTQNQSRLSFKIPITIGAFAGHNDTLKVYFNNLEIKDTVNQLVTNWLSSNGISTSTRTHNFGQDVGKESYGVRIAMRAQSWVQQAVQQGHEPQLILEGFKNLESNFFKDAVQ